MQALEKALEAEQALEKARRKAEAEEVERQRTAEAVAVAQVSLFQHRSVLIVV